MQLVDFPRAAEWEEDWANNCTDLDLEGIYDWQTLIRYHFNRHYRDAAGALCWISVGAGEQVGIGGKSLLIGDPGDSQVFLGLLDAGLGRNSIFFKKNQLKNLAFPNSKQIRL